MKPAFLLFLASLREPCRMLRWCAPFQLVCMRCRIAILGIAFLIAFITQMQAALTRNFHYEMKDSLPTWFSWILIITGPPCT